MRSIHETADIELILHKPSRTSGAHELRAGDDVVGRLDASSWSIGAVAEAADGRWRLERAHGVTRRHLSILDPGSEAELGRFERDGLGRGGTLTIDGRSYVLQAHGARHREWTWSEGDAELATVTIHSTFGEDKAGVVLTQAGTASPDAALLALLGAHLAVASSRQAAILGIVS